MFDTMVITKAVAGFCAALLIFMLGKWAADTLYLPYGPAPQAIFIDLGDDDAEADAVEEEDIDVMALFAEADAGAGAAQWRQCRACHQLVEGAHGVGPSLHGIVGREINAIDGFNYSGALSALGDVWTVEALNAFIENPRGTAPGTTMSYNGMRNLQDRLNLIAYMESESQ
ncbi:MAG: c-type cytochrome [Pararhodobacter sp.]